MGSGEVGFEDLKSFVSLWGPNKRVFDNGQSGEGSGDCALVPDESPVEIGEAKELLQLLPVFRNWPGSDRGNLCGVHLDIPFSHNVSQE